MCQLFHLRRLLFIKGWGLALFVLGSLLNLEISSLFANR